MRERMQKRGYPGTVIAGLICSLISSYALADTSLADTFDGSKNLICSSIDVVACIDGPICTQGSAATFELPQFMLIDFKKKVVRSTDSDGGKETSPIMNMDKTEKQLVLQGIENHQGWTATIDRVSGKLAISVAGTDVSYMILGACTTL